MTGNKKFIEMGKEFAEITDKMQEKFINLSDQIKIDLIQAIKTNCSTYGEVSKVLRVMKQDANWTGNQLVISFLEDVEKHFEDEKNSLTPLWDEVEIIIISKKDKKEKELFRYGVSRHGLEEYIRVCSAVFMAIEEVERDFKEHKQYAYALIGDDEIKLFDNIEN